MRLYTSIMIGMAMFLASGSAYAEDPVSGSQGRPGMSEGARASMRLENAKPIKGESAVEVRKVLGNIASSGLAGDYEGVLSNVSKTDRDRITRTQGESTIDLYAAAREVNKEFRDKYPSVDWNSTDFLNTSFNNFVIEQGNDPKRAQLRIPASSGIPAVTLALVNEGQAMDMWRIDTLDTITSDMIRTNLKRELDALKSTRSTWPSDPNEAAKVVAHRMLYSLTEHQMAKSM